MLGIQASKGFTLIELLVVFFIVAVLTVLALPTLLSFSREHRVTMYAQDLYYALQFARSQAIKTNSTVYVNFQTTDNWCYGINQGSNCTCNISNSCGLTVVSAPQLADMTLTATGLTNNSISFEPTQGAAGAKSVITFTAYGQTTAMSVEIPIMGNVLLCSTTIAGYPTCP